MTGATEIRFGRWVAGCAVSLALGATVAVAVAGRWSYLMNELLPIGSIAVGFGGLTWLALPALPRHAALWAVNISSLLAAVMAVCLATLVHITPVPDDFTAYLAIAPADLPLDAAAVVWPARWLWMLSWFIIAIYGPLFFPDGKLAGPNWRWVGWLGAGSITAMALPVAILWFPTSDFTYATSPFGGLARNWIGVAFGINLGINLLSVSSMIVRYRQGVEEVRRQIRVVLLGTMVATPLALASGVYDLVVATETVTTRDAITAGLRVASMIVLVGSFAIAILRFRLFGLDIIVSKAIVYLALAAFISVAYIGVVIGVGQLLGNRLDFVSSILALIVVAVAVQPLRHRVQEAANRLVHGVRIAPYDVLSSFAERATRLSDEELIERIPRLVVDGTAAGSAAVWARDGDRWEVASSSVPWSEPTAVSEGASFVDPVADHSIPIVHDGDLLGSLSVVVGRGDVLQPTDMALLHELAAGLAVVLQNGRLLSQLKRTVEALEVSRSRVVDAATTVRRQLETDLDQGPRRRLRTLAAGLGPARTLAQSIGPPPLAALLVELGDDVEEATATVGDLARGIYPRRLEADGLVAAVEEQAVLSPVTVTVDGRGVGRYDPAIETAVYFSVLEALQNTAKHAAASSARVTIRGDQNEGLTFEVADDGRGFDPEQRDRGIGLGSIDDRLDTVGGAVEVISRPGHGTIVKGVLPLHHRHRQAPTIVPVDRESMMSGSG